MTPERRGPDENFDPHRSRRSGGCDRGAVWAVPAAAAASVQGISSTSCIADNANILSRDTETYITNISVALQENCSGAQIGVYTTDYVGNNTMEGYAYEVFQAWGLGSADQDNGMVLLMATGDDNYWATPGEGLESAFSGNVLSDLLYDNLEASWAKQDYDTGARKTVLAMAERICDVYASAWIWTRSAPAWQILLAGLWKTPRAAAMEGRCLP